MLKKMKAKSRKNGIIVAAVCVVLAVVLLVGTHFSVFKLLAGPKDMDSIDPKNLNGQYVKTEVKFLFGSFAEETEKNTKTNVTKSVNRVFVLPLVQGAEAESDYYIGFRVLKADYDDANQLVKETYAYLDGEGGEPASTITLIGGVTDMKEKVEKYYNEFFEESGFSEDEISQYAFPYVLQEDMIGGQSTMFVYIMSGISLLLLLFAIYSLAYAFSGAAQKKAKKYILAHTDATGLERVEADCENAVEIKNARIGREWLFYNTGSKTRALKNDQIIWAYMHTVTTRRNGIKTGTTYGVVAYTLDKMKAEIQLGSEANALAALRALKETNPAIVIGYDERLERFFKEDFEGFKAFAQEQAVPQQPGEAPVSAEQAPAAEPAAPTYTAPTPAAPTAEERVEQNKKEKDPWEM